MTTSVRHLINRSTRVLHGLVLYGLVLWGGLLVADQALASRIKEVAAIQGVRTNQLTGFGLVIGLDGTGDQTTQMPYTAQGLNNYLQQLCGDQDGGDVFKLQLPG